MLPVAARWLFQWPQTAFDGAVPGSAVGAGSAQMTMSASAPILRAMLQTPAFAAASARSDLEQQADALDQYVPEGVESVVPLKESVVEIVNGLAGGLRSGISYAGAHTIEEFRDVAELIQITDAAKREQGTGRDDDG